MKKVFVTGILSMTLLTACKNDTPVAPAEPAPVAAPQPSAPVVVPPAPEESDGTSVKLGADGLSVDSKTGNNTTKVDVSGNGANVEIKK